MSAEKINSFAEFYPYYLKEHKLYSTRLLHFIGTSLFFFFFVLLWMKGNWIFLVAGIVSGYFFAWIGHFFFEKNKPATFQYPVWSLLSDFKLYFQIISGKEKLNP